MKENFKMIDYEKIIQDTCIPNGNYTVVFLKSELLKCMKKAVEQSIPLIMASCVENGVHDETEQMLKTKFGL